MPFTAADYEAYRAKKAERDKAAAKLALDGAAGVNPDQHAAKLGTAKAFGLPAAVVDDNTAPMLDRRLRDMRTDLMLSTSPTLQRWLTAGDNAKLAHDDLQGLSWWDTVTGAAGNAVTRGGLRTVQGVNQMVAGGAQQRVLDRDKSFSDLLAEQRAEANGQQRPGIANPIDLFLAGSRWATANVADLVGQDDEATALAYQQRAGEIAKRIQAIPMSPSGERFKPVLKSIGEATDFGTALSQFAGAVASDPTAASAFLLETAAEMVPTLAAATGVTLATRNSTAAAAFMGGSSAFTERYGAPVELFSERGIDVSTAQGALQALTDRDLWKAAEARGQVRGLVVGILDGLSAGVAGKALSTSPAGNMVLQMIAQAGMGGAGELGAQAMSGQDINWGEVFVEAAAELVTAPAEVIAMGGRSVVAKARAAKAAGDRVNLFNELAGQASTSKLRLRMPSAFRDFVAQATANGPIADLYIPAERFREYFQSKGLDDLDVLAEFPGANAEEYQAALETGGDVRIPTADYAAHMAGGEHDAFILDNARFAPDEMTAAEAAEFNEKAREAIEDAYRAAEDARLAEEELQATETTIYETMVSRLQEAGRAADVARTEAMLWPAFYRAMAERTGLTTEELARAFPLPKLAGARPEGMQARGVDTLALTLAEVRQRRAAKSERAIRGRSLLDFVRDAGIADGSGEGQGSIFGEAGKRGDRGEVRQIVDALDNVPFKKKVLRGDGVTVEDAARRAFEAGYLDDEPEAGEYAAAVREGYEVPDLVPAFLRALQRDVAGGGVVFPRGDRGADVAVEREAYLDQIEQYLAEIGADLDQSDAEIRAAVARATATEEGARRYAQAATPERKAEVDAFEAALQAELGLRSLSLYLTMSGDLHINMIAVPRDKLGQGIGSQAMKRIVEFADANGYRVTLTPGQRDDGFGTTSRARLIKFYKRFGFVENKGRNKDFAIGAGDMYREPQGRSYAQTGDVTKTEAFKRWFGDSKVVDENGDPLVVYHGTNQTIDAFNRERGGASTGANAGATKAFFFTSSRDVADQYAAQAGKRVVANVAAYEKESVRLQKEVARLEKVAVRTGDWDAYEKAMAAWEELETNAINADDAEGVNIVEAYLSIQNPMVIDFEGGRLSAERDLDNLIDEAKAAGHDGLILRSLEDSPQMGLVSDQFVAFEPTQIKSVFNRGTFDPADPRILNQTGDEMQGQIQFPAAGIGNADTVIRLFRTANLSTMIHESGHYFLAMYQAMAQSHPELAADYEVIRAWWRDNAAAVAADARKATGVEVTAADVEAAIDSGASAFDLTDPRLSAIDVGMQEQWARAFEAYVMEGKAPSIELRGAFERMRAWLVAVYKRLRGLNVEVSDELRRVFDRMLATDAEIAQASASAGGDASLFRSAEEMGVSEATWQAFQKLRKQAEEERAATVLREAMAPVRREQQEWFRREREAVTEEVTRNLRGAPVYRAIQELRFGKGFDGADVGPIKLSREAIEAEYGAGYIANLPGATKDGKGHRSAVFASGEGGVHPDVVAGMYGFADGKALLDALVNAQPLNAAIRAEVDRILFERHGDVLKDGTVEEIALDALHGDKRLRALTEELKALKAMAGDRSTLSHKQAIEAARRTIRDMQLRGVKPLRFLAAERRAAEDVIRLTGKVTRSGMWADAARRRASGAIRDAVREGDAAAVAGQNARTERANASTERFNEDVAALIEAKTRQILNHALFNEARKVEKNVDRIVDRLGKLSKPDSKLGKSRNIDYVKAARAIAAKFGLTRGDSAFDFNMWVEQLRFDDPVQADNLSHAIAMYGRDARPYRDMTVVDFQAITDAIDSLLETGKKAREIEIDGQKADLDQTVADLVATIDQRSGGDLVALKRRLTRGEKIRVRFLSMLAAVRRVEQWARDMDDGQAGAFTRAIVKPVMDAIGVYKDEKAAKMRDLLAILEPRRRELIGGGKIAAPELGDGYTFENRGEILHAILHTGNESNLQKLLIGRGWTRLDADGKPIMVGRVQRTTASGKPSVDRQGNPIMTKGSVDTSMWDAFLQRAIGEGLITKADFDTAQAIWDLLEGTKRPAQAAHRKMHGFYFDEIEARPVVTPFGTYRGGYVPAVADRDASVDAAIRADQAALEQQATAAMFPTTGSGFTKSRVEQYRTPLALDLTLLPAHVDKVLRFAYLEPAIRQTGRLVNDKTFRGAMMKLDPALVENMLIPWLQRTARQTVETPPTTSAGRAVAAILRTLRRRVGISTMFLNLVNAAQQITGIPAAMVQVRRRHMVPSLVRFMRGDAADMRSEAMTLSALMRDRVDSAQREVLHRIEDAIVKPTKPAEIEQWAIRHGYFLQQATQNVVDVVVWHAAYDQAIAAGTTQDEAVFEADAVIRQTMGDFSPENVSAFETGSAFVRLFTMFYSFFNGQANTIGTTMQTIIRTEGWSGSGRMFFVYLYGIAIPAIVGEAMVQAAKGELWDDEDDDGWADDILSLLLGSQARYVTAMVPGVGQLATAVWNRFNGQFYDDRISTSPILSQVERAAGFPADVVNLFGDKPKPAAAFKDGLAALSLITGIPTGQLAKTGGFAIDVATGKQEPAGPVDYVTGVVSGRGNGGE